MTRRESAAAMLARYGSEAAAGGESVRAVISPLRFDSAPAAGEAPYYRYTGPAGHPLAPGDTVETPERRYAVRRAETASLGGEALFVRAVLQALGGETDPEIRLVSPGGSVLATARAYEARARLGGEPVFPQGEGTAAEIAPGAAFYELSLLDVESGDGNPPDALGEFSVEIREGTKKTVYTGCRVRTGTDAGGAAVPARRSLELLACGRTEEAL